ncbi:hypothetical protein TNCV_2097921 [Trichonephila clavipes]|nr:hypothetical protein TNCV_2097921 [Trichonephila clavipes]
MIVSKLVNCACGPPCHKLQARASESRGRFVEEVDTKGPFYLSHLLKSHARAANEQENRSVSQVLLSSIRHALHELALKQGSATSI